MKTFSELFDTIIVRPSGIAGMINCDGYLLARHLLPAVKDPNKSFLTRGTMTHLAIETIDIETELAEEAQEYIDKDEKIKEATDKIQKRDYYKYAPVDLREKFLFIKDPFDTGIFDFRTKVDQILYNPDDKIITFLDYKTSHAPHSRDITQVYGMIWAYHKMGPEAFKEKTGYDTTGFTVEGMLDYVFLEDIILNIRPSMDEIDELEMEIRKTLTSVLNFLKVAEESKDMSLADEQLTYSIGYQCGLCPAKGKCRHYSLVNNAVIDYLKEDFHTTTPTKELVEELRLAEQLKKRLITRIDTIESAILSRADANKITEDKELNYKINRRKTYSLNKERFINDLASIDSIWIDPENTKKILSSFTNINIAKAKLEQLPENYQETYNKALTVSISKGSVSLSGTRKKKDNEDSHERA
jgi:hypothetical protein